MLIVSFFLEILNPVTNPAISLVRNPSMNPVMNQESHLLTTSGLVMLFISAVSSHSILKSATS